MIELLKALRETNLLKITGSYADGTQREDSDIDFYIKPDHPEASFLGKKRNIEVIKEILDQFSITVESTMIGYWFTHKSQNKLPVQLEFSDLFSPRKNKLKEVEIYGIIFKTY